MNWSGSKMLGDTYSKDGGKTPNQPQVMQITATPTSVTVVFSKELDPQKAEEPGNYILESGDATLAPAQTAVYDLVKDYLNRGAAAVRDFREQHRDNPYVNGSLPRPGAAVQKQRELEKRYFA